MLNKWVGMGRLTTDPKFSKTHDGISVATFSIACDRDKGKEKETDFFPVVAWRGAAEWADKYMRKGSLVVIEGRLAVRKWTDKDGNERRETEIVTEHLYFSGDRR